MIPLMKKIGLLLIISAFLLLSGNMFAQTLLCNDLTFFALDETCSHTIIPDEILDGQVPDNCIVELDRVAPFGNGPWEPGVFVLSDINNSYTARVTHPASGQFCFSTVKVEDKLPPKLNCNALSIVDLGAGSSATVTAGSLNISASDGCSAVTLTPPSLTFDCSDVGISTVQLSAADASGNHSTCNHSVLVIGDNACAPACVQECPASQSVSFEEGAFQLLPAFQAGNLAAFDAFGNALFDPGCAYVDSLYSVDYQTNIANQGWFVRTWTWLDALSQPVNCQQYIVFPTEHTVTVNGVVFIDTDDDCIHDAGEQGVPAFPISVTLQPSGTVQTVYPGPDGAYSVDISFGIQDTGADLSLQLPNWVTPACPNALFVPNSSQNPVLNYNIGLQSSGDCPRMEVSIGSLIMRRCANNYFTVTYCNNGLDTAYGAFVKVDLDELITLQSASLPYTLSASDEIYTFQLGDVPPFTCGTFGILALVECSATPGQTLCNEAHVYPDSPCTGSWLGPKIEASAKCAGDSVELTLRNAGTQNMGTELNYVVVEDFIMYRQDGFQLNVGDSYTIKTEANGSTWRIEAEQVAGYPFGGPVVAAIEGCGGINTPGAINALGAFVDDPTIDQYCDEVRASFDPNDKTAVPEGVGQDHVIRANQDFEYKIRFQNTGTDTAFRVVIVDTLSALLDAHSLKLGTSSHPCQVEVYPGNIVHFVFQPIVLPHSQADEPASHGYVIFNIGQQPDLPEGTRIENRATIYFDQNEAVITNTSFHTIGHPIVENPPFVVSTELQTPACHDAATGEIHVSAVGGIPPYHYAWNSPDFQGSDLTGLSAGTYSVTITDSYRAEWAQTFTLTAPDALTLSLNTSPAHGNQNSGTATALASGGVGPYQYAWSNGATGESISGLAPGDYGVTVTDAKGCNFSQTLQVGLEVDPVAYTVQSSQPKCYDSSDGAIEITVSGGLAPYTYTWENPDLQGNSVSGLPAGTYPLSVTDALGTVSMISVVLSAPSPLIVILEPYDANGTNADGGIDISVSGGTSPYMYLWSTGASTAGIYDVVAGLYALTLTDANGCIQTEEATVEPYFEPLYATHTQVEPSCAGKTDGSIIVDITGGLKPYDFAWNDPLLSGDSLSGLAAGAYDLTITDAVGGHTYLSIVLEEPDTLHLLMFSVPHSQVPDNGIAGAIPYGGTGGYTYLWDNGETTSQIKNLKAGEYSVTVWDLHQCTITGTTTVDELLSANEPKEASQIRIFPNPAHDRITVDMGKIAEKLLRVEVLSSDGRVLQRLEQADLKPELHLELEKTCADGLLLLVFHNTEGKVWSRKVVVE